jgi:hypothetical protein
LLIGGPEQGRPGRSRGRAGTARLHGVSAVLRRLARRAGRNADHFPEPHFQNLASLQVIC